MRIFGSRKRVRFAKGKLEQLDVERADGVDRPATGQRWIVVKTEGDKQPVEKDYAGKARAALEAIAKDEHASFGDETIEALKELAELFEDVELNVAKADEEPVEAAVEEAEEVAEVEKDEAEGEEPEVEAEAADDAEPLTKGEFRSMFKAALDEWFAADVEEPAEEGALPSIGAGTSRLTKSKSKQPSTVEKGEGPQRPSFANVLFDQ